jgi:hypothetical protein
MFGSEEPSAPNTTREWLFAAADFEHLGAAHRAHAAQRRLAILHGDLLRVIHFALGFAFDTISFGHGYYLLPDDDFVRHSAHWCERSLLFGVQADLPNSLHAESIPSLYEKNIEKRAIFSKILKIMPEMAENG